MDGKYITGICTVFVAVLMVGGLLMPIIDHTTEGEVKTNDGAGWIRMNYDTAASAYTINISASDDGITVSNGTDTQTGDDDTIYYADSNLAVWLEDGYFTVLGQSTNGPVFFQSEDDITITRNSEGVSVTDGINTVSVGAPAWAYVPYSTGSYGFFADGTPVSIETPMAAAGGGFAGVYAYNDITRYDGLGLELQTVTEGAQITGAYWAKPSAEELIEPLNPGSIIPINPGLIDGGDADIQPIDPITIDPEPDVSIMSVPTPTYTDGEWGYDLTTIDNVQKAIIVSYSGAGGDIVVPATVGGYDVYRIGKNPANNSASLNNEVFNNTAISQDCTVTISDGIKEIGRCAFYRFTFMKDITIPDSVVSIGSSAFYQSGLTSIVMPDSITFLGDDALAMCTNLVTAKLPRTIISITSTFYLDSNLESVTLPPALTTMGGSAFYGCQKLSNIAVPGTVTEIGNNCFHSCKAFTSIAIPASVTTIGSTILYGCTGLTSVIIASNATPGGNFGNASDLTNVTEILDLSDTVDYSVNRYNLPATATVQDNIGDSIGYISYVSIGSGSDVPASASALMYVIPAIILVSLIIFGAVVFVRRDY